MKKLIVIFFIYTIKVIYTKNYGVILVIEINKISNLTESTTSTAAASSTSKTKDFSSFLGETATLDEIFQKAAKTYGVDVNLLKAIGKQESNFNPEAVSRCGAQGVMQLMPATASELGVSDAFNPEQNIMGGSKYIAQLLKKYDGNVAYALAAYNAGSNNVEKYGGIPPFKETQDYVVKVMAYADTGVEVPNDTYSTTPRYNDTVTNEYGLPDKLLSAMEELRGLFTYDDYINFINIFLSEKDSSKSEEEENQTTAYSALNQINYSPSVLNLLAGKTTFNL